MIVFCFIRLKLEDTHKGKDSEFSQYVDNTYL